MATATSDSDVKYSFGPLPSLLGRGPVGEAASSPAGDSPSPLPILDLASGASLPLLCDDLPLPGQGMFTTRSGAADPADLAPGALWLEGEVILCACPECRATMN